MNKVTNPARRLTTARKSKPKTPPKFPQTPRRPLDRSAVKGVPTLQLTNVKSPKWRSPLNSSTRETSRTRKKNLTLNISNLNGDSLNHSAIALHTTTNALVPKPPPTVNHSF